MLKDFGPDYQIIALDMMSAEIQEIKGYKILAGARGRPKRDIEAIAQVILSLSPLARI